MKSISIDFKNKVICFMTGGQQGTECAPEIERESFSEFFPSDKDLRDRSSFTWDFEKDTFTVNQDYHDLMGNEVMTNDCFVPQTITPMKGLSKRFDRFISLLGYEEVNLKEELAKDAPELMRFLGL